MMNKHKIEGLEKPSLIRLFSRLKKTTKRFSSLLVRDPLDYLDFEVNLKANLDSLIFELNSSNYHPQKPYVHLSPKSIGINRQTVVYDIKDAIVYRFCIESIEDELIKKTRQPNIHGGIKIAPNAQPSDGDYYEKWFKDWSEHQSALQRSLTASKFLVSTDITSYFENINILILKDLVRSDVSGKNNLLNLLFYFLENTRIRYDYEINTFNGLPQENADCSRLLAYYFLSSHDNIMAQYCKENDAEFYRFVDDMSIVVKSEAMGKWALKVLTESLRKLNLVSSIEKTAIVKSDTAKIEMFINENEVLSHLERKLMKTLLLGRGTSLVVDTLKSYYSQMINEGKEKRKNWIKILKRFYTLFSYSESNFFFSEIIAHIIDYPKIFIDGKLTKYLVQTQRQHGFTHVIDRILDYLYSDENLYPALETQIIEALLMIDDDSFDEGNKSRLAVLSKDILFSTHDHKCLSQYSRAIACLLAYRFDRENLDKIATHYLLGDENDNLLKKYIILVTLTVDNHILREKVLNKAKKEQNLSINRLARFVENINDYQRTAAVKTYLAIDKMSVLYDQDLGLEIKREIFSVRSKILSDIIQIYN